MEKSDKLDCKYGANCYQKNPQHHQKYKHPERHDETDSSPKRARTDGEGLECRHDTSKEIEDRIEIEKLPSDPKEKIKSLFLLDMPQDFFDFFKFCRTLSTKPKKALAAVGLHLVGPFDVLDGELKDCTKEEALRHYRYFYDPPEFQTVLKGLDKTGEHYGYYRDDPQEPPCFVGYNEAEKGCTITIVAENLFGALNYHLEKIKKTADPFKKMQIQKIQTSLSKKAKTDQIKLEEVTPEIRKRRSHIVTKTFHGAGIVVPYDKKTQLGYRELAMNDKDLKKVLKTLCNADSESERTSGWSQLQPVITFSNIACDEYDFGTSLELGINLFCQGAEILHKTAIQQLTTAYALLNRREFIDIIKAHLAHRTKNLSELNTIAL